MIDFQRLEAPGGIPVYFQHVPVRSVSVYWLVFVGSADDESVGNHGIYHWFEHIPSRGTVKYPGGYRDTEARLVRHGGSAGAETDYCTTAFYADVPKRVWKTALEILTDMIAQPLLRPGDVNAEREIIHQEIDEWHSSPYGESICRLPSLLWPGHPLGHDQLGSFETLASMDPSTLRIAHEQGYARSRCTLFVAGDLQEQEVLDEVAKVTVRLSDADLPIRHLPASYGPLPNWRSGEVTVQPTKHEDTAAYLLFPTHDVSAASPAETNGIPARKSAVFWSVLEDLITAGDLGSPLHRIVRENSCLAYSPEFCSSFSPDGGYWGLVAQSSHRDAQQVIDRFWDVLRSEELRSSDWFDFVRDTIRGEFDMRVPSPGDYTEEAADRLVGYHSVWSDERLKSELLAVTHEELVDFLESLNASQSHTVLFEGSGRGDG